MRQTPSLFSLTWVLMACCGIVGGIIGHNFFDIVGRKHVDLVIDATIGDGSLFEAYVNKDFYSPLRASVVPGKRHRYVFSNLPGNITYLRLDPTDVTDVQVEIHGMELRQDAEVLYSIVPKEVSHWHQANVIFREDGESGSVVFTSTSNDPILALDPFTFTSSRGWLTSIVRTLGNSRYVVGFWLLWATLGVYQLFLRPDSDLAKSVCLVLSLVLATLVAWFTSGFVLRLGSNLPDVKHAVGYASYSGLEKAAEIRAIWFAAIAGTGVMFLAGLLWDKLVVRQVVLPRSVPPEPAHRGSWRNLTLFVTAVFALLTFPQLKTALASASTFIHASSYDSQNFSTWSYFRHLELLPFRDFWFPYSGLYYAILLPFPPDALYFWLHRVLLFGVCLGSTYCLANRSPWRTLPILGGLFWLIIGLLEGTERYMISVSVVLSFALCVETRTQRAFFLWGAYAFYAFFMEGSQIIYAAPICLLLLFPGLWFCRSWSERGKLLMWTSGGVGLASLFVMAYIAYLYSNGALGEFIAFYRTLGAMANYSMNPAVVLDWYKLPMSNEGALWFATLLLLYVTVWNLAAGKATLSGYSYWEWIPLGLAVLSCMVLQKQLIRPHVAQQLLIVPIFGWVFLATRVSFGGMRGGLRLTLPLALVGGFLGVICFGNVGTLFGQRFVLLRDLPANLRLAVSKHNLWDKAEAEYFSPRNIMIGGLRGTEVRQLLLPKLAFDKKTDLFVLGDASNLYLLFEQDAPFYITFYNQSILSSQKTTVAWLEAHQPKYVLWQEKYREFDSVPHHVRVPLIFNSIIQNYTYVDRAGPFAILQRKPVTRPVQLDFWREHLGECVDLGYIPSRATLPRITSGDSSRPLDYLQITVANPQEGRRRDVNFVINGENYAIRLVERRGANNYIVRLDRIWFWVAARSQAIQPTLLPTETEIATAVLSIRSTEEFLY